MVLGAVGRLSTVLETVSVCSQDPDPWVAFPSPSRNMSHPQWHLKIHPSAILVTCMLFTFDLRPYWHWAVNGQRWSPRLAWENQKSPKPGTHEPTSPRVHRPCTTHTDTGARPLHERHLAATDTVPRANRRRTAMFKVSGMSHLQHPCHPASMHDAIHTVS